MTGGQVDRAVWPDTGDQDPPRRHRYAAATWLLGRHPQLARLAARIPGLIGADAGGPYHDLDVLTDAVNGHHANNQEWADYQYRCPPPSDDGTYDRWVDAGPQPSVAVKAFGVLSSGEKARLRLLAMFAGDRVPVTVCDLRSLDDGGLALLADWCQAVQAQ
jgi:hypothetical protein